MGAVIMKTIEEAAFDYANEKDDFFFEQTLDSFKKGVEFAQRWIPVEEELPKDNSIVLVRSIFPKKPTTAFFIDKIFRCDFVGMSHKQVTHWRPIELK